MRSTLYSSLPLALLAMLCFPTKAFIGQTFRSPSQAVNAEGSALNVGNLFGGLFGGQNEDNGPKSIILMPGSVKPGALKFFLQIYLVGQQNIPSQGSWALNNNDENQSIDMYYKDGTGMFSLGIKETGISVDRYGGKPSLEYVLQESVMLHGLLDELNEVAEADDIEREKRLIQFKDSDAVEKARESLPARKE
eukprot:scaffold22560_cov135-Cylindrotheca_fusiformis.AAC.32